MRDSIHRYKFYGQKSYRSLYAQQLVKTLQDNEMDEAFDILTWVPVSRRRELRRGYDQSRLLTRSVAKELGTHPVALLRKVRHTEAQSTLKDAAMRRANISGAYRVRHPELLQGKRILLIDDVITTGATASECARTLLTAGAKEVIFAAIAAANHDITNVTGD